MPDIYYVTEWREDGWPIVLPMLGDPDWSVIEIPPGTDAQLDRTIWSCLCGHLNTYKGHGMLPVYHCEACGAEYVPKERSDGEEKAEGV